MGLADIRALRETQFDAGLDRLEQAEQRLSELAQEARSEVEGQGIDAVRIQVEARAHLKYAGSHQALAVPFGDAEALRYGFEAAHKARFGFVSPDRELVFDMLEVEAIGATDAGAPPAPPPGKTQDRSITSPSTWAMRRKPPRSTSAMTSPKALRSQVPPSSVRPPAPP
jgi:5-oxoprolinase (ATP-hydrolysing)